MTTLERVELGICLLVCGGVVGRTAGLLAVKLRERRESRKEYEKTLRIAADLSFDELQRAYDWERKNGWQWPGLAKPRIEAFSDELDRRYRTRTKLRTVS